MAKFARPAQRHRLYAWGRAYDFYAVTSNGAAGNLVERQMLTEAKVIGGVVTNQAMDYAGTLGNPTTEVKHQIVLHCTASNDSAEGTVHWWNSAGSDQASAHFVVERSTVAQAARPAATAGADAVDTGMVDAVAVMAPDTITYHAFPVNYQAIGIEIVNVAWGWYLTNAANEPNLTPRCNPQSSCPQRVNIADVGDPPVWRCNCIRPRDQNRWICLQQPLGGYTDYQAFEDGQYRTLALLLRHLSIEHAIARRFLGDSVEEVRRRWLHDGTNAERRLGKNRVFHFRGILYHRNVTDNKACPGVIHRNRLYRSIIDEWWMPVELQPVHRAYYSGPFEIPPFAAGQPTRPSLFRWTGYQAAGPVVEARTYHDAAFEAITEAKSYFDLDRVAQYYAACETRNGGIFPVGLSKVWHGGIHFSPPDGNPAVYAAASGTIVAARVSNNDETDGAPGFGSQRFVLVRHYVHMDTAADPNGVGTSIDWTAAPKRLFSLYMHLGPVARIDGEDNANPPWFNLWRRRNPAVDVGVTGDKGRVFNPDIEVSVGDLLGTAGTYNGRRCLHFEVLSHRNVELTMAPWNVADLRADDSGDQNAICDVATLMSYFNDAAGDGLDNVDLLRGAPGVRNAKTLNKSEWSLTSADALAPLKLEKSDRDELWKHIARLTWWDDAIAANPALRDQIGADGIVWHYHPITLMKSVNELVLGENRQLHETAYTGTNVELDNGFYLSEFINYQLGAWVAASSDAQPLRPYRIALNAEAYHFTRDEAACLGCRTLGQHPQTTRVNLALIDLVEQARAYLDFPLDLSLSHLCGAHVAQANLCIMNDAVSASMHGRGLAIDVRPTPPMVGAAINYPVLRQRCTQLWQRLQAIVTTWFNPLALERGGTASQDALPTGYSGMRLRTEPAAVQTSLEAGQAINNNAVAAAFKIHLELVPDATIAAVADMAALPVRLRVTIESLHVINDLDWFSAGEWELSVSINRARVNALKQSLNSGQVVPLGGSAWTREVSIDPQRGEQLLIETTGAERDVFWDDEPGAIRAVFNAASTPAWGIGRRTLMSPTGAYELNINIESVNARVTGI